MEAQTIAVVLFVLSAVSAFLAAVGAKVFPAVEKVALAVGLAATAFAVWVGKFGF